MNYIDLKSSCGSLERILTRLMIFQLYDILIIKITLYEGARKLKQIIVSGLQIEDLSS